jgi:alpha-mannosidase
MTPGQLLGTWTNFQQKELQHTMLMAFGYGDGGGGPTRQMLENARELAAFPAMPQVQQTSVRTTILPRRCARRGSWYA